MGGLLMKKFVVVVIIATCFSSILACNQSKIEKIEYINGQTAREWLTSWERKNIIKSESSKLDKKFNYIFITGEMIDYRKYLTKHPEDVIWITGVKTPTYYIFTNNIKPDSEFFR
jgi:hypothetical protein